jgi:hypothetical protein
LDPFRSLGLACCPPLQELARTFQEGEEEREEMAAREDRRK